MLAKRLPTILPPLTLEEALRPPRSQHRRVTGAGTGPGDAASVSRAAHTASDAGLLGGNINPTPGKSPSRTMACCFWTNCRNSKRNVLETLRQPVEEGRVTISRAAGTMTFPSQFMLVAAMNPTPGWQNAG